ncbi:MAG TPA: hypothetical protein PLD63_01675 [Ignavibacteria bacterium]|nr:hypothetical protein [Ignavibacteria bacterium]
MKKIFSKSEIKSEENFHQIIKKKKVIVFVPQSHLEKVFSAMADAGAGKIGNYDQCSFRINGTGSFRPLKNTRSFSGKKNVLSLENEIRLEMECNAENVSSIVKAMLKSHPYEETAYEIYDYVKFDKKITGKIIELNRKTKLKVILNRLNKKIISETETFERVIKKVVITESSFTDKIKISAEYFDSDLVLICRNNKYKIFNLLQ